MPACWDRRPEHVSTRSAPARTCPASTPTGDRSRCTCSAPKRRGDLVRRPQLGPGHIANPDVPDLPARSRRRGCGGRPGAVRVLRARRPLADVLRLNAECASPPRPDPRSRGLGTDLALMVRCFTAASGQRTPPSWLSLRRLVTSGGEVTSGKSGLLPVALQPEPEAVASGSACAGPARALQIYCPMRIQSGPLAGIPM